MTKITTLTQSRGAAERCARDGYDTFWIDSGFNAYPIGDPLFNDFEEVEICQCMYSEDLFVGSGNEWESNVCKPSWSRTVLYLLHTRKARRYYENVLQCWL